MAPAREPTVPTYQKDEKALCFHHEFLYEAKVLDSRRSDPSDKNSPLQYRVHYKGWKSTWDDWVPQDRLRKLTEENKQLATNLKREIDEMNPRTAAKSSKGAKKKTAGSDLSSARGSEERQSLPPGRGLKRGRDNEIEKVGSSLSSNFSPLQQSPRTMRPYKEDLATLEIEQHYQHYSTETLDSKHASLPVSDQLEEFLRAQETVAFTEDARDIDVDFWTKEAISLETERAPLQTESALPKKRARLEKHIPLNELSDSALMLRVSKMQRHKVKTIGTGADPPWPKGLPKGPQRHHKWSYTMHIDSHNHGKLAFYADVKPTDHPVIAGFAPENPPPDLVQKSEPLSPPSKRRKAKAAPPKITSSVKDTVYEWRRTQSISTTDDNNPRASVKYHSRTLSNSTKADNQGIKDTPRNEGHKFAGSSWAKELARGFKLLKRRLEIEDSEEETNKHLEQEEHFYARPAVKIEIPDHLKAILVDDWENVTKNLSLVPIPAEHPVSEILDTYFEEEKGKRRLGSAEADLLEEVVQGTRDYFDQCLGKLLLYRFEREQYFRLHKAMEAGKEEFEGRPLKDKKIADIYGAEHLCRLFVSLPELIAQTNMDAQSVSKLRQEIQILTAWLGKNSTRFFTAEYETAPQEYVEKARGL